MITGTIDLLDAYGNISATKRYKSKCQRNEIIKTWDNFYALKNKAFYISITPDYQERDTLISGYVSIINEKTEERSRRFYRSFDHRERIIKEFLSKSKLKKYFLEITPNV